jgi:uncharacterized protein YggE
MGERRRRPRVMAEALAVLLVCALPAAAQDANAAEPRVVTTGRATIRRAPDRAYVTAAVETRARNPRDAQRQNADTMTAVQARIAAGGFPKEAVRTLGYNIQQEFDFVDGRRVSRGYVARNAVEVRVGALDRIGELLDAVVAAGATSVGGVRFDLQDRAGAEREALRLAVIDARQRAEAAAAGAGRALDRVLRIDDARAEPMPRPMPMFASREAAQADQATPIEAGEIEIHAEATLTVSLR